MAPKIQLTGRYAILACVITLVSTGCTTAPKYLKYPNTLTASAFKTIRIEECIGTPSILYVPSPDIGQSAMMPATYSPLIGENGALVAGSVGSGIGGAVQNAKMAEFTADVRKDIDFQEFAKYTVRGAFTAAVKNRPEWKLVSSNNPQLADATFKLAVLCMGADGPVGFFPIRYKPTITIAATLIGTSPALSQNGHPTAKPPSSIFYQRIERNQTSKLSDESCHFVKAAGFSMLPKYSGDVELFKKSLTEAINLAVKQLADSWK